MFKGEIKSFCWLRIMLFSSTTANRYEKSCAGGFMSAKFIFVKPSKKKENLL
jgi:hypothetical protein